MTNSPSRRFNNPNTSSRQSCYWPDTDTVNVVLPLMVPEVAVIVVLPARLVAVARPEFVVIVAIVVSLDVHVHWFVITLVDPFE